MTWKWFVTPRRRAGLRLCDSSGLYLQSLYIDAPVITSVSQNGRRWGALLHFGRLRFHNFWIAFTMSSR